MSHRVFTVSQLIQKWTPTFRSEEKTPIVPIWISLPDLPWHCYHKDILSALLRAIGKVLYLDTASIQKKLEEVLLGSKSKSILPKRDLLMCGWG
ncbi:hypothetical protein H5410_051135 [Solanum commersonii]|uniref:DUF4283 domain-containing protein n=1 Tax=Solanum commersonii TaxID=4109 RepID=A0A9J5WZL6_SOLCO|nr:hypothetical protein H5410_051135 [Solanum commersonii]